MLAGRPRTRRRTRARGPNDFGDGRVGRARTPETKGGSGSAHPQTDGETDGLPQTDGHSAGEAPTRATRGSPSGAGKLPIRARVCEKLSLFWESRAGPRVPAVMKPPLAERAPAKAHSGSA